MYAIPALLIRCGRSATVDGIVARIPGAWRAVVAERKVREYLLAYEHPVGGPKARFFTSIGFNASGWLRLQETLRRTALREATVLGDGRFGRKFLVQTTITSPTGRSVSVDVVWIILVGEDFPRFVTAYPGGTS